jgi:hypothetical protein
MMRGENTIAFQRSRRRTTAARTRPLRRRTLSAAFIHDSISPTHSPSGRSPTDKHVHLFLLMLADSVRIRRALSSIKLIIWMICIYGMDITIVIAVAALDAAKHAN